MHYNRLAGLVLILTIGCKPASLIQEAGPTPYSESVSAFRPVLAEKKPVAEQLPLTQNRPYTPARFAVNQKLDNVLDSISRIYLNRNLVDGFTIQVFNGKKEDAYNVKKQFAQEFPELSCELVFIEPIYKVKAGKYFLRVDAQYDFSRIKSQFNTAILVPERFPINPE